MGTEIRQVLQEKIRTIDGPTVRVTVLDVSAACSSISRPESKRHRSCAEDGLVLAVIGRCALIVRLGVGGGRSQMG